MKKSNRNESHPRQRSLRGSMLVAMGILSVLMLLLLGALMVYVRYTNRVRLSSAAQAYLRLYTNTLENQIASAETYITNEVLHSENMRSLGLATDRTRAYLVAYQQHAGFSGQLSMGMEGTALYLYSVPADLMMSEYSPARAGRAGETDTQRLALGDYLRSAARKETLPSDRWTGCQVAGRTYWVRAVHYYGAWLMAVLDLDAQENPDNEGMLAFSTTDGTHLTGQRPTAAQSPDYLSMQQQIGDLVVEFYAPLSAEMPLAGLAVLGVFVLAMGTFAFVMRYLRRNVLQPLDALTATMARIAGGDLTARTDASTGSPELQQVQHTFNSMLREIQSLKIEQYEKTLEAERYEMKALKMQIRPHFFLNILKIIYAMAETDQTRQIQELILPLAKHLRAVLDYKRKTMTLREETDLCQNYVELIGVGQPGGKPCCRVQLEHELTGMEVPALALLSLVENSVKYGMGGPQPLQIRITARRLSMEDTTLVHIEVRDNGKGFPQEILPVLNGTRPMQGRHFGLYNIRRQCELMFGPDFAMTFTNAAEGGAVVELYIPQSAAVQLHSGKEESADHVNETVDRG